MRCRFDFPGKWTTLLGDLAGAGAWAGPVPGPGKLRALFTLKNVLRALKGKRFVVEAPASVAGLSREGASAVAFCPTMQYLILALPYDQDQ